MTSTHHAKCDPMRHAARPCTECPWRLDQPAGRFPPHRFRALAATSATPHGGSALLDAPLFACHKSAEGRETACAGWLAIEGSGHVAVRLAVTMGRLDPAALRAAPDWPRLHDSFAAMAAANHAPLDVDVDMPGTCGVRR